MNVVPHSAQMFEGYECSKKMLEYGLSTWYNDQEKLQRFQKTPFYVMILYSVSSQKARS